MSWFEKLMPSRIRTARRSRTVPEGVWVKCAQCDAQLYKTELERNLKVCPKCSYHMRISARERLKYFLDSGQQNEIASEIEADDPLGFRDSKKYTDRISDAKKKTVSAISFGIASFFIGILLVILSNCSGVFVSLVKSVRTKPGQTMLTKMLKVANSNAHV